MKIMEVVQAHAIKFLLCAYKKNFIYRISWSQLPEKTKEQRNE
jgi:hypothetical protein